MTGRRIFAASTSVALVAGALAAGAGTIGGAAASHAGVARHTAVRPSAHYLREARVALVHYLATHRSPALTLHPSAKPTVGNTIVAATSSNWNGYADVSPTKGEFTRVSGQWATPAVTCTAEDQLTSEWVGLDGATNSTVEQDGTLSWCFEGHASYYTWYEMYPAATVQVGNTLQPGDLITATVSRSSKTYTLSVTDATHTANSFSVNKTCATTTCLDQSAEWIAERPAFSIGIAPLADYGTWTLSAGSETAGGKVGTISSFAKVDQIGMLDATGTYKLSTTSTLTGGNTFTTTWHNSY
jgi:hypothetical protein